MASMSSAEVRSVGTAKASPPASITVATVSSMVPGSGLGDSLVDRAAHATLAPLAAAATAMAAPTPRLDPVTSTTFPARSKGSDISAPWHASLP